MRVLVVMNAKEVRLGGGIIQVILNIKKGFEDKKDFQFDYAINTAKNSGIEQLLSGESSQFYQLPNKSENLLGYIKKLIQICKTGNYDAIHVHGSSSTMVIELFCAYVAGIKKRIAHCHNTRCDHPIINKCVNFLMKRLATDYLACSTAAGKWVYGESNFTVIHNAFEFEKYSFNIEKRKEQRKLIPNCDESTIVFGMVGNLNEQKNPFFSLELFKEIQSQVNSILIFIGDGDLRKGLEEKVQAYGLNNKVLFLGVCNDVPDKLQMVDVLLFPSLFEGLGLSLIEAQASGCRCVASDAVPRETCYSDDICYLAINSSKLWIDYIMENGLLKDNENERQYRSEKSIELMRTDYCVKSEANKLIRVYNT